MIITASRNSNPDDVIMFFDVLRKEVSLDDENHCMTISVSYLHLWVIEKSKMFNTVFNTDKIFHKNSIMDESSEVFSKKEVMDIKKKISEMIREFDGCSIVKNTNPNSFAPIHIRVIGNGKNDVEKIVDSLVKTSEIIKEIDKNPLTRKFVDRGFRIMIRKDEIWSLGRLSTISKGD